MLVLLLFAQLMQLAQLLVLICIPGTFVWYPFSVSLTNRSLDTCELTVNHASSLVFSFSPLFLVWWGRSPVPWLL